MNVTPVKGGHAYDVLHDRADELGLTTPSQFADTHRAAFIDGAQRVLDAIAQGRFRGALAGARSDDG